MKKIWKLLSYLFWIQFGLCFEFVISKLIISAPDNSRFLYLFLLLMEIMMIVHVVRFFKKYACQMSFDITKLVKRLVVIYLVLVIVIVVSRCCYYYFYIQKKKYTSVLYIVSIGDVVLYIISWAVWYFFTIRIDRINFNAPYTEIQKFLSAVEIQIETYNEIWYDDHIVNYPMTKICETLANGDKNQQQNLCRLFKTSLHDKTIQLLTESLGISNDVCGIISDYILQIFVTFSIGDKIYIYRIDPYEEQWSYNNDDTLQFVHNLEENTFIWFLPNSFNSSHTTIMNVWSNIVQDTEVYQFVLEKTEKFNPHSFSIHRSINQIEKGNYPGFKLNRNFFLNTGMDE